MRILNLLGNIWQQQQKTQRRVALLTSPRSAHTLRRLRTRIYPPRRRKLRKSEVEALKKRAARELRNAMQAPPVSAKRAKAKPQPQPQAGG